MSDLKPVSDSKQAANIFKLRAMAGDQLIEVASEVVVGRDPSCDAVLPSAQASRRHAQLSPRDDGIWIVDLESKNGTFINGRRIAEGTLARQGDVVRFDTLEFRVEGINPIAAAPSDIDATTLRKVDPNLTMVRPVAPPAQKAAPAAKDNGFVPPGWREAADNEERTQLIARSNNTNANAAADIQVSEPTLLGLSDPIRNVKFPLKSDGALGKWQIGRNNGDIRIDHPGVSELQAVLINEGQRWRLKDDMSANGTYVNNKKILDTYLSHGDVVSFGQVACKFLLGASANSTKKSGTQNNSQKPSNAQKKGLSPVHLAAISFLISLLVLVVVFFVKR